MVPLTAADTENLAASAAKFGGSGVNLITEEERG